MHIKIEPVKSNEIQLLSDISTTCFYDTFHQENTKEDMDLFFEKSFNTNVFEQEMQNHHNYFFFSRLANEVVGYIKLSDFKTPVELKELNALQIARIYVVKEKTGMGIGKKLMDFAFSFAIQRYKQVIWLGVWEHNVRAIQFYEKYGFKKFGDEVFMLGNDAQTDWLMKKEINNHFNKNICNN